MSGIFPIGFEPRCVEEQHLIDFDAALFRDGEHQVNLVHAIWSGGGATLSAREMGTSYLLEDSRDQRYGELVSALCQGPRWNVVQLSHEISRTVRWTPQQVHIHNADVLAPDDLWAFIFFLSGFSSGNIWFVLSPKDEVIAALKASTHAKRAPRLLEIMLYKLGVM